MGQQETAVNNKNRMLFAGLAASQIERTTIKRRPHAHAAARTSWMRMCQIPSEKSIRDQSVRFAIGRNNRYGSKGPWAGVCRRKHSIIFK
jgi:hypothetical protein